MTSRESLLVLAMAAKEMFCAAFGDAQDEAGVLHGKETFGNVNIEEDTC